MDKIKIYFGHPMNTYDTVLEIDLILAINRFSPDYEIENPNQKHHQDGCRKYEIETGNVMEYFYKEVLPLCEGGGIFLPFRDGMWGAGVFGEASWMLKNGLPIWEINSDCVIKKLEYLDIKKALTIEQTIFRVFKKPNHYRPYSRS
jgi:hypothetical protein